MALGYRRPHQKLWIPEKYFLPYYNEDITADPFQTPYNTAASGSPYNGVVLPPQPTVPYSDFAYLEDNGYSVPIALIENQFVHEKIGLYLDGLESSGDFPVISPGLTEEERYEVMRKSFEANAVMAYLASGKYVDAQIGRLFNALRAKPELFNNTIIIITSDHGYGLGEKKHWEKSTLHETDSRIPLIIADFRTPSKNSSKRVVSLLDLFPTIIDFADANIPRFPDGTPYLDGENIRPLMANPNMSWDHPAITTYKNKLQYEFEGSCIPQFGIRSEEYHYIHYRTNGGDSVDLCNPATSVIQKELYRIGSKRQYDPNEWNNLSQDPAYASVINYLDDFLPDSSNYLSFARSGLTEETLESSIENSNIYIYPNPANAYCNVQLPDEPGKYNLRIVNTFGHTVYEKEIVTTDFNSNHTIATEQIPSGYYYVIVKNETLSDIQNLMIIH